MEPELFTFARRTFRLVGLNVGCEAASGEILIFLSAHVYPLDEKWLENMLSPFHAMKLFPCMADRRAIIGPTFLKSS